MLPGQQPWGGSGEQCKCPGDLRAWISVHEGDIKDTEEGLGIGESGHQSDWAELYWVSVLTPRNETMFSRRCSMAPLPTQVCILVEACLALCKTKAVESFLGIRPCWEVRNPRRMCSMQGWGAGPLCPAALVATGTEDARQYTLPAGQDVVSVCENQTWGDCKPKTVPTPTPSPLPSPESSQ